MYSTTVEKIQIYFTNPRLTKEDNMHLSCMAFSLNGSIGILHKKRQRELKLLEFSQWCHWERIETAKGTLRCSVYLNSLDDTPNKVKILLRILQKILSMNRLNLSTGFTQSCVCTNFSHHSFLGHTQWGSATREWTFLWIPICDTGTRNWDTLV